MFPARAFIHRLFSTALFTFCCLLLFLPQRQSWVDNFQSTLRPKTLRCTHTMDRIQRFRTQITSWFNRPQAHLVVFERALNLETDDRSKAILDIFGVSAEDARTYPGLFVYCQHLEAEYDRLSADPTSQTMRSLIHAPATCWSWYSTIINAWGTLGPNERENPTLEQLIAPYISNHTTTEQKASIMQAFVNTFCLVSASLAPSIPVAPPEPALTRSEPQVFTLKAKYAGRYCSAVRSDSEHMQQLFSHFGKSRSVPQDNSGVNNRSEFLSIAKVNFACLSTIGRVRLEWVDTMSAHLLFDHRTRTLSVYSYPSVCVACILGSGSLVPEMKK
ncbi:hypothetical protein BDW74DRAFT_91076 [Aspergillus multicolor]|uniref:uncharacterized protein n=1 Tax=Aspergillus multicolor TaxID=41759 RepID=UPI003CCD1945